jgi:uronate dehydrogenase
MSKHRVLVTGSAGAVGRAVCKELRARGHFVRGFDLKPSPDADESCVGSISNMAEVDQAMELMDTLAHLAAEPDDCDFLSRLLPSNIVGLYNVLDSAKRHSLRRVVLTSSMQVCGGTRARSTDGVLRVEDGVSPWNHYAVTKIFAESMGQMYAARRKMSVIAVRISWLPRNIAEIRRMVQWNAQDWYLSHNDAGRFYNCAVEAEGISYCCLFATSKRSRPEGADLESARQAIGYEPMDLFPQGLPFEIPAGEPLKAT